MTYTASAPRQWLRALRGFLSLRVRAAGSQQGAHLCRVGRGAAGLHHRHPQRAFVSSSPRESSQHTRYSPQRARPGHVCCHASVMRALAAGHASCAGAQRASLHRDPLTFDHRAQHCGKCALVGARVSAAHVSATTHASVTHCACAGLHVRSTSRPTLSASRSGATASALGPGTWASGPTQVSSKGFSPQDSSSGAVPVREEEDRWRRPHLLAPRDAAAAPQSTSSARCGCASRPSSSRCPPSTPLTPTQSAATASCGFLWCTVLEVHELGSKRAANSWRA